MFVAGCILDVASTFFPWGSARFRLPQLVYGKIHLVIFSEHVNQAMFYLSLMGILLFSASFLLKKSLVWTAICYAPLPASLISILLGLNGLGQFFISL
jgi:hypothetical protein